MAGRHRFTHFLEEEFAEQWLSCNEATGAWSSTDSMFAAGPSGGKGDTGIFAWYGQSASSFAGSGFMAEQERHRATPQHGGGAEERIAHDRFESIPQSSGYQVQDPPLESIPLPCFLGSFSSSSSASAQPHERATEPANSSTDVPVSGAYIVELPRDEYSSGAWPLPYEHANLFTGSSHAAHVAGQVLNASGQPSFGSMFHASGTCLPCRFHKHPDGCKVGASCDYCHHPHDDWSLPKTQKFFRKHVAAYLAYHGLRGQGSERR
eukprot:TRINITY_DN3051_c0_g2_i1.p1 TRINITY_DN3051_c0_g2~~TRINITY_DN3051_c0_g2_i1.p1  ORF type:complete len:264 (-),score=30.43 TRINITY_DN3051_c0_g2_i1:247-1038(-)